MIYRPCFRWPTAVVLFSALWLTSAGAQEKVTFYPVALFPFQERGRETKDLGPEVTELLFAQLAKNPELYLVDREDLETVLDEQALSRSGLVAPDKANRVGHLTGAKILVTGSVLISGENRHLIAKVIGTETSRVLGTSVKGSAADGVEALVADLADAIGKTILAHGKDLVVESVTPEDRLAVLRKRLGKGKRPTVSIELDERHVGATTVDPASEIELMRLCKELGFEVIARDGRGKKKADVRIYGEGFSEFASRHGDLISVKARLELRAVERKTGRVLAADRQVSVAVDLTELIAAKAALEEAAASMAQRVLPKIVASFNETRKRKR